MKVAHILALDELGGLQTLFVGYATYGASEGQRPSVVNRAEKPVLAQFSNELNACGIFPKTPKVNWPTSLLGSTPFLDGLPGRRRLGQLAFQRALDRLTLKDGIQRLIFWNAFPTFKLKPGADVIVYDHGLSSIHRPTRMRKSLLHRAAKIVCVSESNRKRIREVWDYQGPVDILPNPLRPAIAAAAVPKNPRQAQPPYRLGCASRLVSFKGIVSAIHAVAELRSRGVEVGLTIAGDGPEREMLKQAISTLGLKPFVSLKGIVHDMAAFFQDIDVFLAPSLREPFGLSPLEALAMGVPAIMSNVDGHPDVLPFDNAATLLEPTLNLQSYLALGASSQKMPELVYFPASNTLGEPKGLDPVRLSDAIEDILNNYDTHNGVARKAAEKIRERNSMQRYFELSKSLFEH